MNPIVVVAGVEVDTGTAFPWGRNPIVVVVGVEVDVGTAFA